jgi:hypothetical protein
MLEKFEQRIDTIRLKFKKSLTENQKKWLEKKGGNLKKMIRFFNKSLCFSSVF